jgi:putative FmdB family regulatory protein
VPLYEYECEACGQRFEVIQKFSDQPVDVCRRCAKGPVRRLLSSPAIQFKGSGWYITDYAQKGKGVSDTGAAASPSDKASDTSTKADAAAKSDTAAKADTPATSSPASSTAKE